MHASKKKENYHKFACDINFFFFSKISELIINLIINLKINFICNKNKITIKNKRSTLTAERRRILL